MPKLRPCPVCKGNNYFQTGIFVCKNCKPSLQMLHDITRNSIHADKFISLVTASLRKKHKCIMCGGKGNFYDTEICQTCNGKGYKIPKDYQPEGERTNFIEEEE